MTDLHHTACQYGLRASAVPCMRIVLKINVELVASLKINVEIVASPSVQSSDVSITSDSVLFTPLPPLLLLPFSFSFTPQS
jgi:tRNA(Phe) wybutosine-synthesizing methylase Tyw3